MSSQSTGKRQVAVGFGSRIQWSDDELVKVAQAAESLGYAAIFVAESWGRDHITLLTMLALKTQHIKLGTGVTGAWARTPALMAQTAISLDSISKGRFILGLGTGNTELVKDWHGAPYGKPVQRIREFTDIMRMVWGGQRLEYQGEFFKLGGRFQPIYKGPRDQIPVYIGAIGPKLIELAGEIGDGWMPTYCDIPRFGILKKHLDAGARRAGRDPSAIVIAPSVIACVDDDEEWARLQARERMAMYIGGLGDRYHDLMCRYGFVEEADRIKAAWAQGDRKGAAIAVTDEMVDHIAVVGTPEQSRRSLEAYYAAGIGLPVLSFNEPMAVEVVHKTLEALAPLSAPA